MSYIFCSRTFVILSGLATSSLDMIINVAEDLHFIKIPIYSEVDRRTEAELSVPFIMPHELFAFLHAAWPHMYACAIFASYFEH